MISRRTVTTAAHCLFNGVRLRSAFDIRVIFGSLNRHIYTSDTVMRPAERIIVHPGYRRGESFGHDIGLIIVSLISPSNVELMLVRLPANRKIFFLTAQISRRVHRHRQHDSHYRPSRSVAYKLPSFWLGRNQLARFNASRVEERKRLNRSTGILCGELWKHDCRWNGLREWFQ